MRGGRDVEREEVYRVAEERRERRVRGAERSLVQIRKTRRDRWREYGRHGGVGALGQRERV